MNVRITITRLLKGSENLDLMRTRIQSIICMFEGLLEDKPGGEVLVDFTSGVGWSIKQQSPQEKYTIRCRIGKDTPYCPWKAEKQYIPRIYEGLEDLLRMMLATFSSLKGDLETFIEASTVNMD